MHFRRDGDKNRGTIAENELCTDAVNKKNHAIVLPPLPQSHFHEIELYSNNKSIKSFVSDYLASINDADAC